MVPRMCVNGVDVPTPDSEAAAGFIYILVGADLSPASPRRPSPPPTTTAVVSGDKRSVVTRTGRLGETDLR